MLTREQLKQLRNMKPGEELSFDLNCGSIATIRPAGYMSVTGYHVVIKDPSNFVRGIDRAGRNADYPLNEWYNHVEIYLGVEALPMIRALALALTPRPELKELAPATADLLDEEG